MRRVNFCTLPRRITISPPGTLRGVPFAWLLPAGHQESFANRWGVRKLWGRPQFTMAVSKSWSSTTGWSGVPMSRNFHFASSWFSYMGMKPTSCQFSPLPCVPDIPTPNLHSPVHPLSFSALLVGWGYGMLWDSKTMKYGPEPQKNNHPADIILAFWNLPSPTLAGNKWPDLGLFPQLTLPETEA